MIGGTVTSPRPRALRVVVLVRVGVGAALSATPPPRRERPPETSRGGAGPGGPRERQPAPSRPSPRGAGPRRGGDSGGAGNCNGRAPGEAGLGWGKILARPGRAGPDRGWPARGARHPPWAHGAPAIRAGAGPGVVRAPAGGTTRAGLGAGYRPGPRALKVKLAGWRPSPGLGRAPGGGVRGPCRRRTGHRPPPPGPLHPLNPAGSSQALPSPSPPPPRAPSRLRSRRPPLRTLAFPASRAGRTLRLPSTSDSDRDGDRDCGLPAAV